MTGQPASEPPTGLVTAELQVYLLGPPNVERAGRSLVIPRRQARALLYYLAAHLRPAPREQLCFLFWPDTPESTARRNLSRLLTHLRRALSAPKALVASNDHVGLDPERVWSDTAAFQDHHNTPQALPEAVDLYRGPFLDGFSMPDNAEFEAWLVQEQQSWERRYLQALATLIEAQTADGAPEAAIAYARRYLAVDELAEDVHRRLIELYAAIGDHSAALRQFEYCATVLERELGVGPLPETQAVYQAVLQGRPQVRRHETPAPVWTTRPSLEAPLMWRKEALYRLARAYERAQLDRGGVVLISGEAGIGKSRLMQDFVSGLENQAMVVSGGGHEAERDLPYWPLVGALEPHLPSINWAALNVESLHLAEVARLFPKLRTLLPNLPPPAVVEPGQEQGRLFLALARLFLGLATRRPPLILCLDDLHWADETTLAWLGYLGRQIKRAPLLVLGAYRSLEAARVATLRAGLLRQGVLQEVMLEGLLPADVRRLVRRVLGQAGGDGQLGRHLYRETGGNPFFLLETVRAMSATDPGRQGETAPGDIELPLADAVHEAIQERLRPLPPQARRVLEAGAVIGQPFDLDLVQAVSGLGEGEVLGALESLLARQLITAYEGQYEFNHGLARTAVYRGLGYDRRRRLHRRVVEASRAAAERDV